MLVTVRSNSDCTNQTQNNACLTLLIYDNHYRLYISTPDENIFTTNLHHGLK